jgi:hypothetical protein
MQYDEGIRDRIVRIHEMEVEASIRQKDKVIDCGVEMDQRQSAREDLLTTAEIREAYNAQIITAVINLSLVVVCVILGLNGAKEVAITALGALAVVNVATLFTPLRQPKQLPHGESGEAKGAEKGDEQRD